MSMPRTPEYRSWAMMLNRCRNPRAENYQWYGGRGIKVCERWFVFKNFLADVGLKPSPRHSLDRIDNDGHYEPGNVRWATQSVQAQNSSKALRITIGNTTLCAIEWERRAGLPPCTVARRYRRGWRGEQLLVPSGSSRAVQGELNPAAKLSALDVQTIREKLANGQKGRHLAASFGVSETTISGIKKGRVWKIL